MAEKTNEEIVKKAPEKDLDASMQGAAVFSNKFTVSMSNVVRISFLEQTTPEQNPYFRTAVVMGHQDAISLYKLLQGLLKDMEKELEVFIAETKKK